MAGIGDHHQVGLNRSRGRLSVCTPGAPVTSLGITQPPDGHRRNWQTFSVRISGRILLAAILTGFFTGLFVALAEKFFLRDGVFGPAETLATFVPLPLLAALLVSIGLRRRHLVRRLTGVAFLTLAIPLIGIGIGGANVLQQMLGGAIGGGFWGLFFATRPSRASAIS